MGGLRQCQGEALAQEQEAIQEAVAELDVVARLVTYTPAPPVVPEVCETTVVPEVTPVPEITSPMPINPVTEVVVRLVPLPLPVNVAPATVCERRRRDPRA